MNHTSAMLETPSFACHRAVRALWLVALCASVIFLETPAEAQRGGRHWNGASDRGVWAEFDRFDVARNGNQLWANYAFSAASWGTLRRLNIQPRLQATVSNGAAGTAYRRTTQQSLTGRTGRVLLPALGGSYRAELSVVGDNRRTSIAGVRSGALRVQALVFEDNAETVPVATPCGGPGQRPCQGHVQAPQVVPPTSTPSDAIKACGEVLYSSAQQSACVKVAASSPHGAKAVRACGEALHSHAQRLACIETAVRTRYNPAPLVSACKDALFSHSDRLKCIEIAVKARRDPAATVKTCGESMHMQSARLQCIENAT